MSLCIELIITKTEKIKEFKEDHFEIQLDIRISDLSYFDNSNFKKTIGDKIVNSGYYEFLVQKNWAIDQNRARRYRMGAVSVALLSGGTIEPK